MKYRNTIRAIVVIGAHESVHPFAVTRDFDEEDLKAKELRAAIAKGYLVPWDGKEEFAKPASTPGNTSWTKGSESVDGKLVRKPNSNGVGHVEYIVADAEGGDSVGTSDGVITAMSGAKSPDHIEKGLDAGRWVNASQAYDQVLDDENAEASFDDEDSLSEKEGEGNVLLDADEEIARDATQMLVNRGQDGAELRTVRSMVEESVTKNTSDLNNALRKNVDDSETVVSNEVSNRVVDFLGQPFSAKKWVISRESDPAFLAEVRRVTQSDNIRSLADQRIAEISKQAA